MKDAAGALSVAAAQKLRADDCKRLFAVHGLFYVQSLGGRDWSCRSVLELIAHDLVPPGDPSAILDRRPDLLVVMMNPGSSRAIDKGYAPPRVSRPEEIRSVRTLVPTVPDTTQYQVMKVMAARGWRHARVLNLSDLRESKSALLFQHVRALAREAGGACHSIFCPQRRPELLDRMGPVGDSPPVLLGWGRHRSLDPLAEAGLAALEGRPAVGVPAPEGRLRYAHPSPQMQAHKDAWLANILDRLDRMGI